MATLKKVCHSGYILRKNGSYLICSTYFNPNTQINCHASSDSVSRNIDVKLANLQRGTGGRSSFSGLVTTVFGATGFLGRYVCNRLGKIGSQIIIPYRCDAYDIIRLKMVGDLGQVNFYPFFLKNEDDLYKVMKYSNCVINLIGHERETSNFSFEDVHVTGARNIARIAKECGVQRLIHLSAWNANEERKPIVLKKGSDFYPSKWRGEQAVKEEFPEATIIRPSDMFGDGDRFLTYYRMFMRRNGTIVPLWKFGNATIKQPVFVSNVAEGIINAIFDQSSIGKTYAAVGPHRFYLGDLVDYMYHVMRKDGNWRYARWDIRFNPLYWFQLWLTSKITIKKGLICYERVEREYATDENPRGFLTLEDLGVKLNPVEEIFPYELYQHRAFAYWTPKGPEELEPLKPPKMSPAEF